MRPSKARKAWKQSSQHSCRSQSRVRWHDRCGRRVSSGQWSAGSRGWFDVYEGHQWTWMQEHRSLSAGPVPACPPRWSPQRQMQSHDYPLDSWQSAPGVQDGIRLTFSWHIDFCTCRHGEMRSDSIRHFLLGYHFTDVLWWVFSQVRKVFNLNKKENRGLNKRGKKIKER